MIATLYVNMMYYTVVIPNCGPIPTVEHSTHIRNSARVTYTCLRGFTLVGSSTLTCLASETWSPDTPTCIGMLSHDLCIT